MSGRGKYPGSNVLHSENTPENRSDCKIRPPPTDGATLGMEILE